MTSRSIGVSVRVTLVAVTWLVAAASCGGNGADSTTADESPASNGEGPSASGPVHEFLAIDAGGPLTKDALASGDIDVAVLFTSSAGEAAHGWVHLVDDRGLQPAENFVPAVHESSLTPALRRVLNMVSASLTEPRVQEMVDGILADGELAANTAREFVAGLEPFPPLEGEYTVGRAGFAESELASEIYAAALEAAGASVERTPELGFREVYFPAIEAGDVDVMPEFVGAALAHLGGRPTSDLTSTLEDLRERAAARGVVVLEPAPAESKDGLYTTRETAEKHGLVTVSDLRDVKEPLRFGGPAECPQRDLCLIGLQDVYGLRFTR
jgi:osmoprotectant transport system substrate-binding protein